MRTIRIPATLLTAGDVLVDDDGTRHPIAEVELDEGPAVIRLTLDNGPRWVGRDTEHAVEAPEVDLTEEVDR